MVFTEEEKKQRKKEKNKEYYENNKQKVKEYHKTYYQNNKEVLDEKTKEWTKTPKGKMVHTIGRWKYRGIIHDNFEELYNKYLDTTECDVCKYVFDERNFRCLDHDHNTGLFRQFLCNNCNSHDRWKNYT